MPLNTKDLPVGNRPDMFYKAVVISFELKTSQTGNPRINVTLQRLGGGKRFDNINLRANWFDPEFKPNSLTDQKERNMYYMSVGKRGRAGKILLYLGEDYTGEFNSPQELAQVLSAVAVGKKFWVKETQQWAEVKEKKIVDGEEKEVTVKVPTENYNLNLYDINKPPTKAMEKPGVVVLDAPEEEEVEAATTA